MAGCLETKNFGPLKARERKARLGIRTYNIMVTSTLHLLWLQKNFDVVGNTMHTSFMCTKMQSELLAHRQDLPSCVPGLQSANPILIAL